MKLGQKQNTYKRLSIFLVLFSLLLSLAVGFYVNPLFVSTYKEANVGIPEDIFRFVRYDGFDLIVAWVLFATGVLAKDRLLEQKYAIWLNILLILFVFSACIYYPKAIDIIHLPMLNNP